MSTAKHEIDLQLRGSLDDLDAVHRAISDLAADAKLPDEVTTPLRLALDELITNVVEHGFRGQSDRHLQLHLLCEREALTATLSDNAPPFDPTAHHTVDTAAHLDERPIGGLGIHLVRKSIDEMHYQREGGLNRLTIRKRLPQGRLSAAIRESRDDGTNHEGAKDTKR